MGVSNRSERSLLLGSCGRSAGEFFFVFYFTWTRGSRKSLLIIMKLVYWVLVLLYIFYLEIKCIFVFRLFLFWSLGNSGFTCVFG